MVKRLHAFIVVLALCAFFGGVVSAQAQSQTDSPKSQPDTAKPAASASGSQQSATRTSAASKTPAKDSLVFTNDNLKDSTGSQAAHSAAQNEPSGQRISLAQDPKQVSQQAPGAKSSPRNDQSAAPAATPKLQIDSHKVLTNDDLQKLNKHGDVSVVGIDVDLNGIYDCDISCYNRVRDTTRIYPGMGVEWMRELRSGIEELQKDNDWRAFLVELAHVRMKFCSLATEENAALQKADNFNNVTDQQIDIREQYNRKLREADDEVTAAYSRISSFQAPYSPLVRNFMQMQVLRIMQAACSNPRANYRNYSDDPDPVE